MLAEFTVEEAPAAASRTHRDHAGGSADDCPDAPDSHAKHSGRGGRRRSTSTTGLSDTLAPTYASRFLRHEVPKNHMPPGCMPASIAAQIIRDELTLDGTTNLNLATFVDTYMEPEAEALLAAQMKKNAIDSDEYPRTQELQDRCVRMLADLFHVPVGTTTAGTSTVGSSEGCILGGLAMKLRWRDARRKKGLPCDKPNIVISTSAQVIW